MTEHAPRASCFRCCTPSIAICVNCNRQFCWLHFNEHRRTFENYLNNEEQPLSACLTDFEGIEKKLYTDIDHWEHVTISETRKCADQARRSLDAHLNSYRAHFNEESSVLQRSPAVGSRDHLLNRLEELQVEYGNSLSNLRLVKHIDRGHLIEIETKNAVREQTTLGGSSQTPPQECGDYVAQTTLGDRLTREPQARTAVGSYWAMGGSDQYLLVQEYENKQLTLFDCHGTRGVSMTWHYDLAIRDINWYEATQQFIVLLDKKIILFNPVTKHFQEVTQVKPYQSNAFRRCTCFHDRLFIAYWGLESVVEMVRISTWETEQRWLTPVTCRVNEAVACIRLNSNDQLALCIQDENNPLNRQFRFEIRDIALNILHTLPLYVDSGILSRMIPLPDLHWAVLNVDENLVFVVNERGELLDRIEWPRAALSNIALVGQTHIVLRTTDKLYFYDVEFQHIQ